MDANTEIFQLKDYELTRIAACLEKDQVWKTLILHLPTCLVCFRLGQKTDSIFSDAHIELFERDAFHYSQSPAENLLNQWALYGSAVPTISDLCSILKSCGLEKEHKFVRSLIIDYSDGSKISKSDTEGDMYAHKCTKLVSGETDNNLRDNTEDYSLPKIEF